MINYRKLKESIIEYYINSGEGDRYSREQTADTFAEGLINIVIEAKLNGAEKV